MMAASAACSNPHVFAHTLRFSARVFLALTKNAWFLEVPLSSNLPLGATVLQDQIRLFWRACLSPSGRTQDKLRELRSPII